MASKGMEGRGNHKHILNISNRITVPFMDPTHERSQHHQAMVTSCEGQFPLSKVIICTVRPADFNPCTRFTMRPRQGVNSLASSIEFLPPCSK